MAEQTEAQRLADVLEEKPDSDGHCRQAAAELRRLEWDNQELRRCAEVQEVEKYAAANRRFAKINAQLLEALKYCRQKLEYAQTNREWYSPGRAIDMADAAIAAAKGEV
jgi:hypothetical protein